MTIANFIVLLFYAYLVAGLCFAVWFVSVGAGSLDPSAKGVSRITHLFLLPGSAALWPVLWRQWIKKNKP
jgi:hypothetical protein